METISFDEMSTLDVPSAALRSSLDKIASALQKVGAAGTDASAAVDELRTSLRAAAAQSVKSARSLAKFDEINRLSAPAAEKADAEKTTAAAKKTGGSARKSGSRSGSRAKAEADGEVSIWQAALQTLRDAWDGFWLYLQTYYGPAIAAWQAAWEQIKQTALAVWEPVRAAALDVLTEVLTAEGHGRTLPRTIPREPLPAARPTGCRVAVTVTNPACARAAKRAGAHLIYVPALNYRRGEAVIAGQKNAAAEQAGYPKGCIPIMPVADHEAVGGAREAVVDADVWKYAAEGKPLLAESLGAMERASEEGALLDVGSHVPITNGLSLAVASEFGAARVWLSPELTLRQIEEVAKDAPVELGVLLIGAQELMVTEHCMLMSQGPCDENCAECPRRKSPHVLKDRKGYEFPVVTDAMGRSHLYNAVELDIASSMPELLAAGISSYMVDATLMNAEETAHAVGRAIRALHVAQNDGNAIAKMPNTTSGHLYRGVS